MKTHSSSTRMAAAPSLLTIHKDSRTISRLKPKIRIIHVIAPEIIKTDVENFRELVQKLTGQSTGKKGKMEKTKKDDPIIELSKSNAQRMKQESEESWTGDQTLDIDDLFADMENSPQEMEDLMGFAIF